MKLKTVQEYAESLSRQEGWSKESLKTRLDYLHSEVQEAIEEVYEYNKAETQEDQERIREKLSLELFDIIWNVAELANRFDIDLEVASEKKMRLNANRKFSIKP